MVKFAINASTCCKQEEEREDEEDEQEEKSKDIFENVEIYETKRSTK